MQKVLVLALPMTLALSCLSFACQGAKDKDLSAGYKKYLGQSTGEVPKTDDAKNEQPKGDEEKGDDESITPPVNISGAFLKCVQTDSFTRIAIDLGCRVLDANDERVLLPTLAEKAEYLLPSIYEERVVAELQEVKEGSEEPFDVHYILSGADFRTLRRAVSTIRIELALYRLVTGEKEGRLMAEGAAVLSELPKPWWVREFVSDTYRDGQCQSDEICRFQGNGLMWLKDNGLLYGQAGARSLCELYSDEFHDWRLPTQNELSMALAKNIRALTAAGYLHLRSSRYWTNATAPEGTRGTIFDLEMGVGSERDVTEGHGVLCVRDDTALIP